MRVAPVFPGGPEWGGGRGVMPGMPEIPSFAMAYAVLVALLMLAALVG